MGWDRVWRSGPTISIIALLTAHLFNGCCVLFGAYYAIKLESQHDTLYALIPVLYLTTAYTC